MNTDTLLQQLRTELHDARPVSRDELDVSGLIGTAVRVGHRRRTTRRVLASALGGAAVVGVVVAGSALGPFSAGADRQALPAAPPSASASPTAGSPSASAFPSPSASPSASASPSDDPRPTPGTSRFRATGARVLRTLSGLVPSSFAISQAAGDDDLPQQAMATMTLSDGAGKAWLGGGVGADFAKDAGTCLEKDGCTEEPLAGGTLQVMRDAQQEKAGEGTWYYFLRPDGGYVWLGQANAFQGNGPVTRPTLPLTEEQVRDLLTDPAWDAYFTG